MQRVVRNRLKRIVQMNDNQCGFVEGRSTFDTIQCMRITMEEYREAQTDLHLVFIDLEKAFNPVPRDLIWVAFRSFNVPEAYVRMIQDMYNGATTKVRCTAGESMEFPVNVGVHQGSVLSPLLFNTIMSYLLTLVSDGLEISLLFADDIVLGSKDMAALQIVLTKWCNILEDHGLRISIPKTESLCCPFADPTRPAPDIYIKGENLKPCEKFKYLGSMVNWKANCNDDINHRIGVDLMRWR